MECLNCSNIKHAHSQAEGNDSQMLPLQSSSQSQTDPLPRDFLSTEIELRDVKFAMDLQPFIEITEEMGTVAAARVLEQ